MPMTMTSSSATTNPLQTLNPLSPKPTVSDYTAIIRRVRGPGVEDKKSGGGEQEVGQAPPETFDLGGNCA